MRNKLTLTALTLLLAITLVACGKKELILKFETNGGTAVIEQKIPSGSVDTRPVDDPYKEGHIFTNWHTDANLTTEPYKFGNTVSKSFTLYAAYRKLGAEERYAVLVDHRQEKTKVVLANEAGVISDQLVPTRGTDYRFGGWFTTKAGLTWNDTEAYKFTEVPKGGVTLYAYWEPVNSFTQTWAAGESYTTSLDESTTYVFNPMNYTYNTENQIIDLMSTPLYTQEVDWNKAIEDGIAEFPGDFSKIGVGPGKFGVDLLKNHYILAGAAGFPKDANGHDLVDADGRWDRDAASSFLSDVWTVELRKDLVFTNSKHFNGRAITAEDYVYSYMNYIDKKQNNTRGATMFPNEDRGNGYPIINSRAYFLQQPNEKDGDDTPGEVKFADVGFKAIDDYTIELRFEREVGQTSAVGLMNLIRLVHKETYEKSLDVQRENSSYGTVLNPYVSYGAYIMKTWDEGQKIVMNKNYDYVLKHTINFKSYVYQFTDNNDTIMDLFKKGELSAVGLIGDYAAEYAEWENKLPGYNGYPVSIDINVTDSQAENSTRKANPILKDVNFRKALLYGLNRQEFTNTVFAPNTPSIMIWPIEAKQYAGDEFWYKDTPEHKEVLALLGISEATDGYDPVKAKQYFDLALDAWKALPETNGNKVTVSFITYTSDTYKKLANYLKQSLEQLFGADNFELAVDHIDDTTLAQRVDLRDFDLAFDTGGWGFADSSYVYMALKGLFYTSLFGPTAGGNDINAFEGLIDSKFYKDLDLTATLEYLESTRFIPQEEGEKKPFGMWDETTDEGTTIEFYNHLKENDGMFVGKMTEMWDYLLNDSFIFSKNEEPFPGAVSDLTKITAGWEELILKHVTLLPLASRTSETAYAANVVITWPEYSYELGWGSARYRYLNTDIDFAK